MNRVYGVQAMVTMNIINILPIDFCSFSSLVNLIPSMSSRINNLAHIDRVIYDPE